MRIEVETGVFWDTDQQVQSESAIKWLQEKVRPNLGEPTLDKHQRPDERTFENDHVTVVEKQVYINDHNWARKNVKYTVIKKD